MDSGIPISMNVEPSGSSNNGGGFGWGGDGAWWIILFLIFAMFGWGGFGGYGNNGGGANGSGFQGYATRSDINEGFALNNLQSGINDIQQGICNATNALNSSMQSGFNGLQAQISNLGAQLSQCCCDIREAIQNVNYNMSTQTNMLQQTMNTNTRDIIDSQNAGTRAILDYLCNEKISSLQAENQALRLSASQDRQNALLTTAMTAQTQQLLNTLNPTPVPAYPAASPAGLGNWSQQVLANGNNCNCNTCFG